jgi:hypothetical protein
LLNNLAFLIGQISSPKTWPAEILASHLARPRHLPQGEFGLNGFAKSNACEWRLNPCHEAFNRQVFAFENHRRVDWWNFIADYAGPVGRQVLYLHRDGMRLARSA